MKDVSVTFILWCYSINQIFLGLSNGGIKVLYDPVKSQNGIIKCITKKER